MMSQKRSGPGCVGHALVHQGRRAVGEDSVDHVGVSRDPADVGGAPVGVGLLQVEDRLGGRRDVGEVAARGVEDALGLARRSARIEDEERVLGVELRRSALRGPFHEIVPPVVAPRLPCDSFSPVRRTTTTCLHRVDTREGFVDGWLQRVG